MVPMMHRHGHVRVLDAPTVIRRHFRDSCDFVMDLSHHSLQLPLQEP